jgi:ABC-type transporter lipoprotein component MlaA
MLPLLGPSTLRDAPSKYVDSYTGPYRYINDVPVRNSVFGLNIVDTRASLLSSEKLISGDKYTFIRNATCRTASSRSRMASRRRFLISTDDKKAALGPPFCVRLFHFQNAQAELLAVAFRP